MTSHHDAMMMTPMAIADAMRMIDVEARVHALSDLEGSAAVAVPRKIS
jgi:hypothetical protein